jgi:uncharacterized membrane protein
MNRRTLYGILTAGAGLGLVASFLEMVEYIAIIKRPSASLVCDLNGVFSCSNVLTKWQSSVFGFPNPMMCMVFFTLMLGFGLVGLYGGTIPRGLRIAAQGISLFFLGFGLWFLEQSTFSIRSLCILCIFCFAGLMAINASWLRLNSGDLPLGRRIRDLLQRIIARGTDIFGWLLLAIVIAFVMFLKFR